MFLANPSYLLNSLSSRQTSRFEALHPALSRPGRCVAEIEFDCFSREQAVAWAGRRSLPELPAKLTWSLAELYAHAEGREISHAPARAIGFAGA